MSDIKVSICCLAYNHESFIRQCLDSFVMQKTNFAFEVLIHDDASTDETASIIKEYETEYPDIIKPIYQKENQFSKGVKITRKYNFPRAKGKYIAICEGDDYWLDSLKLQKQVDFLENNEDYSIVHTDVNVIVEKHSEVYKSINKLKNRKINSGDVFLEKLLWNYRIFTATSLFRNSDKIPFIFDDHDNYLQGDLILFLELFKGGLVKYFDEATAVYRVNKQSVTNSLNSIQRMLFKQSSINIRLRIAKKYNVEKSVVDELKVLSNEIQLELYYLQNNKELMKDVKLFFEERNIKLKWQDKYKMSVVLDKGPKVIFYKCVLRVIKIKTIIISALSDLKKQIVKMFN